jgi:hypothetical protein
MNITEEELLISFPENFFKLNYTEVKKLTIYYLCEWVY